MYRRSTKFLYIISLLLLDLVVLAAAFGLTFYLRLHLPFFANVQPVHEYYLPAAVLIGICIAIFFHQGLYRDIRDLTLIEEYAKIIKSMTYAFLIGLALTFFFKVYERSRILFILFWAIGILFMILIRFAFYHSLRWLRAKGLDPLRVAVVGSDRKVRAVNQLLKKYPQLGFKVAAQLILPGTGNAAQIRKWIDHEILGPYQRDELDGVIVCETVKKYELIMEVAGIFKMYGIPHRNVTEAFDLAGFKAPAGEGLEALMDSLNEGQTGGGYKVFKRFIDESLSIIALVCTLPIWLPIMIAIKLDSKGPIFFKQERVGYHGRKFLIYKFRSMYVEAPKYAKTPKGSLDPRITPVGRFIRKTSLDELPQLINVIKGEMSLVGPRPEMPFIVEKYKPIYRYRLMVLPGLTGLWQVSGRTDKPLEENVKYDLYYIKNQSLLLDLVILLRTIPAVLFGKGAY